MLRTYCHKVLDAVRSHLTDLTATLLTAWSLQGAGDTKGAVDVIDKLEGMDSLLDRQHQVLVGDSPLSSIKFRPGAEEPLAGSPVEGGDDDDKKGPSHRPYSFQQRRNKKI